MHIQLLEPYGVLFMVIVGNELLWYLNTFEQFSICFCFLQNLQKSFLRDRLLHKTVLSPCITLHAIIIYYIILLCLLYYVTLYYIIKSPK
jgi:hypothetical protein